MGKTRQQRTDETVAFVVRHVPQAERVSVTNYLQAAWQGWGNPGTRRQVGGDMHIGSDGTSDERAMRRACILLAQMLDSADRAVWFKGVGVHRLTLECNKFIYRVRLLADQASNTVHLLQSVFETVFRPDPENFLRQHRLMINGAHQINGAVNVLQFNFSYDMGYDRFVISAGAGNQPGAYNFNTISVPAIDWKAVPNRTNDPNNGSFATIDATQLTGQTVMVTTQFTGCAFCLKRRHGLLYAAHVSPSNMPLVGTMRGPTVMARQLAGLTGVTAGDFSNAGGGGNPFRVYGAGYSNLGGLANGYPVRQNVGDYMVIVGFHTGAWTFYSQHISQNRTIAGVDRFTYV